MPCEPLPKPEPSKTERASPEAIVRTGDVSGTVSAGREEDFVWIRMEGEPNGEALLACLRGGLKHGLLTSETPTLVDLTSFTGPVDWAAVHRASHLAPCGGPEARIAYLVRNRSFVMLVRVAGALFPRTRHRPFMDRREAIDWLRSGYALDQPIQLAAD